MNASSKQSPQESGPVQLRLDLSGGWSPQAAAGFRRAHRRGFHRCESPLERQLALAFSGLNEFKWRGPTDHPWQLGRWDAAGLVLLAQAEWLNFYADFALVPIGWKAPSGLPLVVEVDGHDFHERTKEQAEHDRRRDRLMIESGATVLRFTGREVWRNARACADEVLTYARSAASNY